ncbi:MAG: hypothetical protein ABW168_05330, partial [Sedimenticola sp.]
MIRHAKHIGSPYGSNFTISAIANGCHFENIQIICLIPSKIDLKPSKMYSVLQSNVIRHVKHVCSPFSSKVTSFALIDGGHFENMQIRGR